MVRLLEPGPVPSSFSQSEALSGGSSRSHLTQNRHLVIWEDYPNQFGPWKSSFSTFWIPRWESVWSPPLFSGQIQSLCLVCSPEKEVFPNFIFGLVWPVPVSSSKHASAADAKLCLTRRMQSKLFAAPARLARALLKKWDSTVVLHLLWFVPWLWTPWTHMPCWQLLLLTRFGGSEFLYGLAQ